MDREMAYSREQSPSPRSPLGSAYGYDAGAGGNDVFASSPARQGAAADDYESQRAKERRLEREEEINNFHQREQQLREQREQQWQDRKQDPAVDQVPLLAMPVYD